MGRFILITSSPSYPTLPVNSAYQEQKFFATETGSANTESLSSYWQQASYGQTSATGSQPSRHNQFGVAGGGPVQALCKRTGQVAQAAK